MSSIPPALPAYSSPAPAVPAKSAPLPPARKPSDAKTPEKTADTPPRPLERHAASALSPSDIGYVDSLLGVVPAQIMEYILLKTGIPQPAHLGQDLDTTA